MITSILKCPVEAFDELPQLMTDGEAIILVTEFCGDNCCGIVISGDNIGDGPIDINISKLKIYNGKITLKNT